LPSTAENNFFLSSNSEVSTTYAYCTVVIKRTKRIYFMIKN